LSWCRRSPGSSRHCRSSSPCGDCPDCAGRLIAPARRFADVWWCAATLAAKPLILAHVALLEPTAAAYWLILAVAVLVPMLALLMLPRRVRPWALLALGIFCSLLILADVVYYRFFGDVLSTAALLAAGQTGHVWDPSAACSRPACSG